MKKEMTDIEIAEVFSKNITNKKYKAIDTLICKYLNDVTANKKQLKFVNEHDSNKVLMANPREYARWCLVLATDYISDYSRKYMTPVKYTISNENNNNNNIEFVFEIPKNDSSKNSIAIIVYITKNGMVVDINNNYISIVKERMNKEFTGVWKANISNGLRKKLPIFPTDKVSDKKVLVRKFDKNNVF